MEFDDNKKQSSSEATQGKKKKKRQGETQIITKFNVILSSTFFFQSPINCNALFNNFTP